MAKKEQTKKRTNKDTEVEAVVEIQEPAVEVTVSDKVSSLENEPEVSDETVAVETEDGFVDETPSLSKVGPELSKDIETVVETSDKFIESEEAFSKSINEVKTDDEVKKLITDELKKVNAMKNNVQKIIKKYSNMQISNSWNGMIEEW